MRKLTIALAAILALMVAFAAWFVLGGTLRSQVSIQTARASDYPEAYGAIRSLLASGAAPQTFADPALPEDSDAYTLVDMNIRLANGGLFPAEWLHIEAEPADGDIAVYALTGEGSDVPVRDENTVNLKLITTAPADAMRTVRIEYYVHGMKREIVVR